MNPSDIGISSAVVRLAPTMEMLGDQIASRRRKLMLTQKDLAEMSGVSLSTVCSVELGKANPTVKELSDLIKPIGLVLSLQERVIHP